MRSGFGMPAAGFCLLLVFVLWIIYQADTGTKNALFIWVEKIPGGDKIGHIWLYGGLAFLLNLTLGCRSFNFIDRPVQWGSALVLVFAVLEELTQGFFATRTFDYLDLLADFFGVYLAALLLRRKSSEVP